MESRPLTDVSTSCLLPKGYPETWAFGGYRITFRDKYLYDSDDDLTLAAFHRKHTNGIRQQNDLWRPSPVILTSVQKSTMYLNPPSLVPNFQRYLFLPFSQTKIYRPNFKTKKKWPSKFKNRPIMFPTLSLKPDLPLLISPVSTRALKVVWKPHELLLQ